MTASKHSFVFVLLLVVFCPSSPGAELPVLPIGYDAYLQWERWPYQRIGERAYMRSTYDRRGGNEAADASHFLYQLGDDNNVALDVAGPGVLYFVRHNHWHGSPWRYVVDDAEHIVQESSTTTRDQSLKDSVFLPREQFPDPLAVTWAKTKGADLSWVPIPFERSFRLGYTWTCYGTGYFIYHQWVPGTKLSQPLRAWDGKVVPPREAIDLFERAGTDLVADLPLSEKNGSVTLPKDQAITVQITREAPAMLRALDFSVPREAAIGFGRARLRITWDERPEASVEAPVALFFGAGTLYNRDDREFLVKAFPVHIRYDAQRVHLACYFPMPFFRSAKIELIGNGESDIAGIEWRVRQAPLNDPPAHVGYFHATFRDHGEPTPGRDLTLLDTRGLEGSIDWSGSFIGTSFIFSDRSVLTTLEGDPRFFFDDSETPQAQGTGTEEWGGGGDYWGGRNMTLPFAGHPVGAPNAREAKDAEDHIQSAYRFLLADQMPFGKNVRICLEHGGENLSDEHYRTVTYWYGRPGATLAKTDELKIGDAASERGHRYMSPQASEPYEITSRYELGPDALKAGGEGPLPNPADFAEFAFEAAAGTYLIWVRGQNLDGKSTSDASWLQFDSAIGTNGTPPSYTHPKGVGNWLDRFPARTSAWSSALPQEPPLSVTFNDSGRHRLRIQPRHPGHLLEQVWLSRTQKALPPPEMVAPNASADEIILRPDASTVLRGKVQITAKGALEMNGTGSTPTAAAEIYPVHTDTGRKTTGTSEFTLKLDPQNVGVMLRRKLDYAFPNQRAEVSVTDESTADWRPAGTWYLAGSNTCVFSRPPGELGPTVHIVQTSNRRFRDDEFLLPRALTAGRSAIRIRVKFTPTDIPLFPGRPLGEQAWSEVRYDAWCFLAP